MRYTLGLVVALLLVVVAHAAPPHQVIVTCDKPIYSVVVATLDHTQTEVRKNFYDLALAQDFVNSTHELGKWATLNKNVVEWTETVDVHRGHVSVANLSDHVCRVPREEVRR